MQPCTRTVPWGVEEDLLLEVRCGNLDPEHRALEPDRGVICLRHGALALGGRPEEAKFFD